MVARQHDINRYLQTFECDECKVREARVVDIADGYWSRFAADDDVLDPKPWQHEWSQPSGLEARFRNGKDEPPPLTFCSRACLDKHLSGIANRSYPGGIALKEVSA